mgnify:CR=1 FL=1
MASITFYKATPCGYCTAAFRFLVEHKQIPQEDITIIDLTGDVKQRRELAQKTGQRTVPQIYINGQYIGGYTELIASERRGELAAIIALNDEDYER